MRDALQHLRAVAIAAAIAAAGAPLPPARSPSEHQQPGHPGPGQPVLGRRRRQSHDEDADDNDDSNVAAAAAAAAACDADVAAISHILAQRHAAADAVADAVLAKARGYGGWPDDADDDDEQWFDTSNRPLSVGHYTCDGGAGCECGRARQMMLGTS